MNENFEGDAFENEEDRKNFETFYHNYLRSKQTIKIINEYYSWLSSELNEKNYAVVPFKYTGIKNLPLCIIKLPMFSNALCVTILN